MNIYIGIYVYIEDKIIFLKYCKNKNCKMYKYFREKMFY